MNITGILELLERVGVRISLTGVRVLLRNFHTPRSSNPPILGCPISVQLHDFLEWLPRVLETPEILGAIQNGNALLKNIWQHLESQHLSLFELYALCDTSQDGSVTVHEMLMGCGQVLETLIGDEVLCSLLWEQFEKN